MSPYRVASPPTPVAVDRFWFAKLSFYAFGVGFLLTFAMGCIVAFVGLFLSLI